jgi:hypothetical protein
MLQVKDKLSQMTAQLAYEYSVIRKARELESLLNSQGYISLPSHPDDMLRDWLYASSLLSLKILSFEIDLTKEFMPDSYWRLEESWLDDVIDSYAYSLWESSGRIWDDTEAKKNFTQACNDINERLIGITASVNLSDFPPIGDYISSRYLSGDNVDLNKAKELINSKARRAHQYDKTGSSSFNSHRAEAENFVKTFYANVIPAVKRNRNDEKSFLVDAVSSYSNACGRRFHTINAFEAAIMIYFV